MNKITFLVSGNGGNLKFLYFARDVLRDLDIELSVVADRDCRALDFAKNHKLMSHQIDYKRSNPSVLQSVLSEIDPDLIVTNWHKIIDPETVGLFEGKMINLHYSLLPAFGGLIGVAPIIEAYRLGCKFIGPTCHLVDEGVDTGRILAQAVFATDQDIDESISIMFRMGCMTLLNAILSHTQSKSILLEDHSVYGPPLTFDSSLMGDEFWKKVSQA